MMYPLNLSLAVGLGYAVANNPAEHAALTLIGYIPSFVGPAEVQPSESPPPPRVSDTEDKPRRGRPPKVRE